VTQEEREEKIEECERQMHVQIVHLLLLVNLFVIYIVTTVMVMVMCSDLIGLLWGVTMCTLFTVADKQRKEEQDEV